MHINKLIKLFINSIKNGTRIGRRSPLLINSDGNNKFPNKVVILLPNEKMVHNEKPKNNIHSN